MNTLRTLLRATLARAALLAASTASAAACAQTLPPIYDRTPVEIKSATTVAEFPAGTFLENIAIGEGGTLYVNSYLEGKVYRIGPDGQPHLVAMWYGVLDGEIMSYDVPRTVEREGATYAVINDTIVRPGDAIGRLKIESATTDGVWLVHWKGRDHLELGRDFTLHTPAASPAALASSL